MGENKIKLARYSSFILLFLFILFLEINSCCNYKKQFSVDRIEGEYIICQDNEGEIYQVKKNKISFDVQEGEFLEFGTDGKLKKIVLPKSIEEIKQKAERLWKDK